MSMKGNLMPELGKDYRNRRTGRTARVVNVSENWITVYHANGHTAIKSIEKFNQEFEPEPVA
jgi:hypothetical protein